MGGVAPVITGHRDHELGECPEALSANAGEGPLVTVAEVVGSPQRPVVHEQHAVAHGMRVVRRDLARSFAEISTLAS